MEYSDTVQVAANYTGRLPHGVRPGQILTRADQDRMRRYGSLLFRNYKDGKPDVRVEPKE